MCVISLADIKCGQLKMKNTNYLQDGQEDANEKVEGNN